MGLVVVKVVSWEYRDPHGYELSASGDPSLHQVAICPRLVHARYCWRMVAPMRLLAMNDPMNSCRPVWKMSSTRRFWNWVRMVRAWRCAGPCRP